MKKYNILIALAIIMSFSSCQQKEKQSNTQDEIVGVYQMIGNREGMFVMTDKYFVYAGRAKNESSPVDSIDYYKNEYDLLRAEVCTWTRQDSIINFTFLFYKDPSWIGQSWRFTYSFKGDTILISATVPTPNKEVIINVSAIKLE
jgi:hypothetical protein